MVIGAGPFVRCRVVGYATTPLPRFLLLRLTNVSVRRTPGIVPTFVRRKTPSSSGVGRAAHANTSNVPVVIVTHAISLRSSEVVGDAVDLVRVDLHGDKCAGSQAHLHGIGHGDNVDEVAFDEAVEPPPYGALANSNFPGHARVRCSSVMLQYVDDLKV